VKRPHTGGRRRIVIDVDQVAELASIGMNLRDIAVLLEVPEEALHRRCSTLFAKKRMEAKRKVLAKQYEAACNGVVPMSIWWGKNYGEQSDRADVTSAGQALKIVVERMDK
jgi:hypothetical protein